MTTKTDGDIRFTWGDGVGDASAYYVAKERDIAYRTNSLETLTFSEVFDKARRLMAVALAKPATAWPKPAVVAFTGEGDLLVVDLVAARGQPKECPVAALRSAVAHLEYELEREAYFARRRVQEIVDTVPTA